MKLIQIYKCFCDETRLRMLNLLGHGPLCVCHFQSILRLPQVTVSKHLAYLRSRDLVKTERRGQWMIYSLPERPGPELALQLKCLQDCVQSHAVFKKDVARLERVRAECGWVSELRATRTPAHAQ
jgi:ArsR family transcriptional regulator